MLPLVSSTISEILGGCLEESERVREEQAWARSTPPPPQPWPPWGPLDPAMATAVAGGAVKSMQTRTTIGKAIVRLSSMSPPMAEKVVAAAEVAVRCVFI